MDTLVLSIDEAYEELQKSQKEELIKKAQVSVKGHMAGGHYVKPHFRKIETIKETTFEFEGRTIRLVPEKPSYSKPGFTYLKVFVDGKHFGDIDNHHSGVSGLEWSYHESAYGPEGMKYDKEGKSIPPNKGIDNPYAVNYDGLEKHIRKLHGAKAQAIKEEARPRKSGPDKKPRKKRGSRFRELPLGVRD